MRAARLLRILLLLQARGRMTAAALAAETEVAPRTILRDVDALTEAGVPVVCQPGPGGGIALAFDWRTRLTGLDSAEAEALALVLAHPPDWLADLGLEVAARAVAVKVAQALPAPTRAAMAGATVRFGADPAFPGPPDPRAVALAGAIRRGTVAILRTDSAAPLRAHPARLVAGPGGWVLHDARPGVAPVSIGDLGRVTVTAEPQGNARV
jgi:predicted DNA-binding transcriptional regulator YafY